MPQLSNHLNQITIQEAARHLGVSRKTLRRWEANGSLVPQRTAGGHRRYTLSQINEFRRSKARARVQKSLEEVSTQVTELARTEQDGQMPRITVVHKAEEPKQTQAPLHSRFEDVPVLFDKGLHSVQKDILKKSALAIAFIALFAVIASVMTSRQVRYIAGVLLQKTVSYSNPRVQHEIASMAFSLKGEKPKVNTDRVLAFSTTSLDNQTFNVYVKSNLKNDVDVAGTLNLIGNTITASDDLLIDPGGGGTIIGTATATIDLAGGDFFVSDELEIGSSLTIGGDTISDFVGTGLQVTAGVLETTLGDSIESPEIVDGTIAEADLAVTNTPSDNQILSYDSATGTFTWVTDETGDTSLFTDGGATTYLTSQTDDFAIGGTGSGAALFFDESAGDLTVIGAVTLGSDLTIGTIGLSDTGTGATDSGASLIGVYDEFANSSGTNVQDVLDDLDAAIGAGSSKFTQDTGFVYLTNSTDEIVIGGSSSLSSKLAVDGDADETQLLIQGNGSQTSDLVVFETSGGTDLFTVDNSGNLTLAGSITVNSDAVSDFTGNGLTLSSGALTVQTISAADALSATTSNGSGIEVFSGGIGLLQGCADGEVLKWNETNDTWACSTDSGASSAIVNIQNNDVAVGTDVDTIDFSTDFTVTASPSNEANVSIADDILDFTEFSDTLSLDADTSIAAGAGEELTYTKAFTNNTGENGLVLSFTASDTGAATTSQYGLYLDNLASTEGIDALAVLDNSDTDDAVTAGLLFVDAGGGFTTGIDLSTTGITNALDVNSNFILFDAVRAFEGSTGTLTFEDTSGNDIATFVDQGTTGDLTITGVISAQGTTIGLNNDADANNVLSFNAGAAGIASGDLYWGNDLVCDVSETNCGWTTAASAFASFDVTADSGSAETVNDGNTLTIAGGTNGIDTTVAATDTITINLDTTEIGTTTFGSGSGITWTFDASGGTDPTLTFGSDSLAFNTDLTFENSETLSNATDTEIALSDGTNTLTIDFDEDTASAIEFVSNGSTDIVFSPGNYVGIGTTQPFANLHVVETKADANLGGERVVWIEDKDTTTTSGTQKLVMNQYQAAPSSASSANYVANWNYILRSGSSDITGRVYGVVGHVADYGQNTTTNWARGVAGIIDTDNTAVSATITYAAAGHFQVNNTDATSTITNAYGVYVPEGGVGSGTITNRAGIALETPLDDNDAGNTTNRIALLITDGGSGINPIIFPTITSTDVYGIYNDGGDYNYFGSPLGIGDITPDALLDIAGAEGADATLILDADEGDDATDTWTIQAEATGNDLAILNDVTEVFNLTTAGNLQIDGTLNLGTNTADILAVASGSAATNDLYWGNDLVCDVSESNCGWATSASSFSSWTVADDDGDTYSIVDSNILRFTSSDSNVLTNLTSGDDADENLDFSIRLLGDAVAGSGLTGGADNILVGADGDTTFDIGAGTGITVNADDVAVNEAYDFTFTGDVTFTPAGTDNLDINLDSDSLVTLDQAFSSTTSANSVTLTLTNASTSGTQNGLVIDNAASTGTTDALLVLDNSDTDTAVTTGISFVDAGGGITTGIDLSASGIVTALDIDANFLLFDGVRIFEGSTGTLTIEDTSGNDIATFVDQGTTGDLTLTGVISAQGTTIGLNNDADANNVFTFDAAAAGTASGDLYWGDDLVCDVSESNCGWVTTGGTGASKWSVNTTPTPDITYLTETTFDLAVGGSDAESPLFVDVSASALNLNPFGVAAGNTGEIRFQELEANGDHYTGFKSPDSLTASVIYTLPTADATSANQVLVSDSAGVLSWTDVSGGSGAYTGWTLTADSGSNQTISSGNTVDIAGGTNGIDTVVGVTDTVTINLDTTEIGSTTFGSGSGFTWTFDAGTTDPSIDFGDDDLDVNVALTTFSGAIDVQGTTIGFNNDADTNNVFTFNSAAAGTATGDLYWGDDLVCDVSETNCGWTTAASSYTSWTVADDDGDTYAIVDSNILRFTSSDSNVLTNLASGDDADENLDFSIRLLGDAVAGSGLTGGADNVLVGADGDTTFDIGAGNGITVNADDVAVNEAYDFTLTGDVTFTPAGTDNLDFNLDSDSLLTIDQAFSSTTSANSTTLTLTNASSSGTQNGLVIDNAASTGTTEALLVLDNSDTDTAVTTGISFVDAGGGITTGIDLSTTGIVTALDINSNVLLFDGIQAVEASTGTLTIEDTSGNDIATFVDQGTTGDLTLTGVISAQGTTIGLNNDADANNVLSFNTGAASIASGDLYWGNDLVCDVSETNCGWTTAASAFTSFTAAGDAGGGQTIADGNTLSILGGTNGIDTIDSATDTVTINLDTTEIGTTTFGSGSALTWTFNAGATDPTLTFDSNSLTIGSAVTTLTGSADGTDSLVLTAGDILLSDGDFDISGGDFNVTLDAGDGVNIAKGAAATADVFTINGGTSATDGVDNLQLTFGVSAASGNVIDITPSYADATAGATNETYNIIDIDAFTATQNALGDTGLISGLNIGNLTQTETAGTITANALQVGTGWDSVLDYNGTTVINGSGQLVSSQITGTLFTAAGDSGSSTIIQGDTLTLTGGTGIATAQSGDTNTFSFDCSEVEGTDIDCSTEAITLETTLDSVDTINLAGTGTLNALDAVDSTTENTIEGLIFDADAETITGVWTVADSTNFRIGTGGDLTFAHDGTDTTITSTTGDFIFDNTDVDDPTVFRLGTDTTATAFEVRNNSDAVLFTIDGSGAGGTNANTFGLNFDADANNILGVSAAGGIAGSDLYWGDDLVCDVSETNCGWTTAASSFTSFDVSGDTGTDETIENGNILSISGGTNGIDTVIGATDTLTINLDTTEIGTTTFGSGSALTWTFNAGATDPTLAFDSNSLTIGSAVTTLTGSADGTDSLILTAGDILLSDGDFDISGGDFNVTLDAGDGVNIAKGAAATTDVFTINGGTSATDGVDNLQLTFGVSAASGNVIDITPSYADATAGATSETYNIIDIDAFTATQNATGDTGSISALNVGNLTQTETAGTITANALQVGTGWDSVLDYNGTTVINGTGQLVSTQLTGTLFSTDTDTASANTIVQGDTLTINGDSNGIDVTHSGDTMTVAFDGTEVGSETWGSGSAITWTFDASGGVDPTLTFGNDSLAFNTDLTLENSEIISNATNGSIILTDSGGQTLTLDLDATDPAISTSTGGLAITLGSSAGDDLNIDSGTFVIEGDNNRVGISDATPDYIFDLEGTAISNSLYWDATMGVVSDQNSGTSGNDSTFAVVTEAAPGSASSKHHANLYAAGYYESAFDTSGRIYGSLSQAYNRGNGDITGWLRAVAGDAGVSDGTTGHVTNAAGGHFQVAQQTAATITNAYGVYSIVGNYSSGTITAGHALYAANALNSGGGTLTGASGVTIEEITSGTNDVNLLIGTSTIPSGNYSIYNASTDDNYFAGELGIGVTPTAAYLDLAAATTAVASLNITSSAATDVSSPNSGDLWWNGTNLYFYNGSGNTDLLAGGFSSFTAAGDSGGGQTISDGNTLSILGGTNGIDTVDSATDTITLNLDTTEVGTTTFGSGSGITWTFNAGATDPQLVFGSDSLQISSALVTIDGTAGSNSLNLTAGDAVLSDGSLTITDADNAASFSLTNNTATTIGAGVFTDGVVDITSSSLTTGNLFNLQAGTALTTGNVLAISTTSTALTSGQLGIFDWSPGSATTASGDLFTINIGTNGSTTGSLFAVQDTGSDLFSVSETGITSALPHSFTAAGDVSIAYDIILTNQTASGIESYGPLTITSGESFENNNLTLRTYGTGNIVANLGTSGGFIPATDDTHDLGSASFRWDDVYATNGTIQTSDERLKNNVTDLGYGLAEVLALRPVNFTYIGKEDEAQVGFIAQEVLNVIPEVVDVPEDGSYLGIRYANFAPIVVSAIQEQQAYITQNSTAVTGLQNTTNNISNQLQGLTNLLSTDASGNVALKDGSGTTLLSGNSAELTLTADEVTIAGGLNAQGEVTIDTTADNLIAALSDGITKFNVDSAGNTFVGNLEATPDEPLTTGDVCYTQTTINGDPVYQLTDCGDTPADLAEWYPVDTEETPQAGQVVKIGNTLGTSHFAVEVANDSYDSAVIGIVSTEAHTIMGEDVLNWAEKAVPVALAGRVPVKIDPTSEAIESGDLLTSSTGGTAKKATEAGYTIGNALESWTPESGKETILVFVQNSVNLGNLAENNNEPTLAADELELIANIEDVHVSIDSIEALLSSIETDQDMMQEALGWELENADGDINVTTLGTQNLYVTELATVEALSVNTSIVLGNDFVISSIENDEGELLGTSINTIDAPLSLQGTASQPLSIMAGKILIDTDGNVAIAGDVAIEGDLKAETITTDKLVLSASDTTNNANVTIENEADKVSTASIGKGVLAAGTNSVEIQTTAVSQTSLIYVTPTSSTLNKVLYIKGQIACNEEALDDDQVQPEECIPTFVAGIDGVATQDIEFNWWIVDTISEISTVQPR